jgi:uncharacterized membrane protein
MEFLAYVILGCFLLHLYVTERVKRKVAYTINISERTEEAETINFAVHLFDDEPFLKWQEKLERAYSIAEARRAYNNKRMMDEYQRVQAEAKKAKEEGKITSFKS